jgi:small subunit ribosomal protein S17
MSGTDPIVPGEAAGTAEQGPSAEAPEASALSAVTRDEPATGPAGSEPPGVAPEATSAAGAPGPATKASGAAARRAARVQGTGAAPAAGTGRTGRRKVREGTVVSNAMEKTAVVVVIERVRHPRYAKTVQRTKRLYVHDETNDVRVGDRVRLSETRPLSKLKRWRVQRVLERAR